MAYNLSDINTAAHYWANRVQERGRAGNVFFEANGVIYSYGMHFAIARHLKPGYVVISTNTYSSSTGRHQSAVRSAARHLTAVYVPDADDSPESNRRTVMRQIEDKIAESNTPRRIRQTTRDGLVAAALHLAEQFNEYLAVEPEKRKTKPIPVDVGVWKRDSEKLARAKAREQKRLEKERAAHLKARQAQLVELETQWRAGEDIPYHQLYDMPVMLRLHKNGAEIETSHGARVPTSVASRIYPLAVRAHDTGVSYQAGDKEEVGVYRLKEVRGDGTVIVGCHTMPFREIERMANILGLGHIRDELQSTAN